jgi:hypothetical protein
MALQPLLVLLLLLLLLLLAAAASISIAAASSPAGSAAAAAAEGSVAALRLDDPLVDTPPHPHPHCQVKQTVLLAAAHSMHYPEVTPPH